MKETTTKLLAQAEKHLEEAREFFSQEHDLDAMKRSYACISSCAQALLHENGVDVQTDEAIQAKFDELFIKTALMESRHGEKMHYVSLLSQSNNYDLDLERTEENAGYAIEGARQFLEATKILLPA